MVNNQNSRSTRNRQLKNVERARAALVCLVIACSTSLVACQSLGSEEGALPDAIRSAGAVVSGSGYPDLSKIPPTPKNMPSEKNWLDFETGLKRDARRLALKAGAQPVTAMEIDQAWANQAKSSLEAVPNALPVETSPTEDANWAAKARARIEADIARLPPS
jgi:hypothetical protein